MLSLVPGAVALFVILFGVKEIIGSETHDFKFLAGLKQVLQGQYLKLLVIVSIFSLGAFNYSFILLNAKQMGVSDALVPIVYAVVNVTHTIIAIPAGRLSDKVGKEKVLLLGYIAFAATAALLAVSPASVPFAYLIAAVFGLYMGVVETVQRAMIHATWTAAYVEQLTESTIWLLEPASFSLTVLWGISGNNGD